MIVFALALVCVHHARHGRRRFSAYLRLAGWISFGAALIVNSSYPTVSGALVLVAVLLAVVSIFVAARTRGESATAKAARP
jgi:hypothetical protein